MPLSNGVNLIGIYGKAGSGKNTIADYIQSYYANVYSESFAGPLKKACSEAFGIPPEDFSDRATKEKLNEYWNVSPRQIAQYVGTELFRNNIEGLNPNLIDFWIKRLAGRLTDKLLLDGEGEYSSEDTVIITDIRFQNEYEWIINNGGYIIHVVRPSTETEVGIPNHASEAGISFTSQEVEHYRIENTGTLGHMFNQVDTCIKLLQSIIPLSLI